MLLGGPQGHGDLRRAVERQQGPAGAPFSIRSVSQFVLLFVLSPPRKNDVHDAAGRAGGGPAGRVLDRPLQGPFVAAHHDFQQVPCGGERELAHSEVVDHQQRNCGERSQARPRSSRRYPLPAARNVPSAMYTESSRNRHVGETARAGRSKSRERRVGLRRRRCLRDYTRSSIRKGRRVDRRSFHMEDRV